MRLGVPAQCYAPRVSDPSESIYEAATRLPRGVELFDADEVEAELLELIGTHYGGSACGSR